MGIFASRVPQLTSPAPEPAGTPVPPLPSEVTVPAEPRAAVSAVKRALLEGRNNPAHKNTAAASEIKRIVSLPIIDDLDPEEVEEVSREVVQGEAWERGFRLLPPQAAGYCAWRRYGGLFGNIGVGLGKTFLNLLNAHYSIAVRKAERVLLLVPNSTYPQLFDDLGRARRTFRMDELAGKVYGLKRDRQARKTLVRAKKRGLYVMPYSLMRTPDTSELLEMIAPDDVLADEAHNLRHKDRAQTKRWLEVVRAFKPRVSVVSGTISGKTLDDFAHLIKAALGANCPLPMEEQLLVEWSAVVDAGANPSTHQAGPLKPLVGWARKYFPRCDHCRGTGTTKNAKLVDETCGACNGSGSQVYTEDVAGFRKAFKHRLTTAPGSVTSGDAACNASLMIVNQPADTQDCQGWSDLDELIRKVVDEWVTPNGDEIAHKIHTFKWLEELTAGFYNQLTWPTPDVLAERRGISARLAESLIERAKQHHGHGQHYMSELRAWLSCNSRAGLDTPRLVGLDMLRHGMQNVGPELYALWREWKDSEFEGRPERDSTSVRVCDYKIRHAIKWAKELPKENPGGLVWYKHQEMGRWLTEALTEAGLDVLHCPAGPIYDEMLRPENADKIRHKIIVLTIGNRQGGHGEGKNLWYMQNQLVVQVPRPAITWEQLLGRCHRTGQEADELFVHLCNTTDFDHQLFSAVLNDALYIHQALGNRQKAIYCAYDPLPEIHTPEFLREHGFQNKLLTQEQRRMLREKFERIED